MSPHSIVFTLKWKCEVNVYRNSRVVIGNIFSTPRVCVQVPVLHVLARRGYDDVLCVVYVIKGVSGLRADSNDISLALVGNQKTTIKGGPEELGVIYKEGLP